MDNVIKLFEPDLEMATCDNCGCCLRFGFMVDESSGDFKIVRIICQCGQAVTLEYDEE